MQSTLPASSEMSRRTFVTAAAVALLGASSQGQGSGRNTRSGFNPGFATARATAEAVWRKQISVRELLQETFRRIDRYNPRLNAIIIDFRDRALARAKQADDALATGKRWGPLHGVPVTIKEAFAYEYSPNSWGIPEFKGMNSFRTAAAVERLESSGAIVIGKTNIPTGLSDIQTHNAIYGSTNNPWDPTLTPGGSTGGGAAAIAAGFGPLTLGSDSGGSIRVPAHLCGVYGHKPTVNLVSLNGHEPGPWDGRPAMTFDMHVAGPLARDAGDLALALSVLGGPVGDEALAWTWRMPPPRQKRLRDFRIGYVTGERIAGSEMPFVPGGLPASRHDPIAGDVLEVHEKLLTALARTGARLERGWPEGLDSRAQRATAFFLGLSTANTTKEELEQLQRRMNANPDDIRAAARAAPYNRWLIERARQLGFRAAWQTYFKNHDVFLLPAAATAAFPHDHSEPFWLRRIETPDGKVNGDELNYWYVFATLSGLPATVAPVGRTRSGLPVGIQILAPMWEDGTSIEFAALLADLVGGFTPPPGYED